MAIRPATLDDGAQLAVWHATSFNPAWTQSDFQTHIAAPFDHVLISDNGFIIMRCVDDGEASVASGKREVNEAREKSGHSIQAEILTLVVDPFTRRSGQGRELVRAGERAVSPTQGSLNSITVFLDVAVDNAAAIALYGQLGYYHYGDRPGYYRRPNGRVGARLYQKTLPPLPENTNV